MNAIQMQRIHLRLARAWFVVSIPVCVYAFFNPESAWLIAILVVVSFYANTAAHWAGAQSAKVEMHQDKDADVSEVLEAVEKVSARLAKLEARVAGHYPYPYPYLGSNGEG